MKALLVGGGIGGLTAALCLHEIGIEVRVFESVETIRPLGVGINLLPHAVHSPDRSSWAVVQVAPVASTLRGGENPKTVHQLTAGACRITIPGTVTDSP